MLRIKGVKYQEHYYIYVDITKGNMKADFSTVIYEVMKIEIRRMEIMTGHELSSHM